MSDAAANGTWTAGHDAFLRLNVRVAGGPVQQPEAAPGFSILELLRAFGMPIKAECGGSGVCATCHIRVAADWQKRLPAPSDGELAKLDEVPGADDSSRLACQIRMTEDLDGLALDVQADSIALHAAFLAG